MCAAGWLCANPCRAQEASAADKVSANVESAPANKSRWFARVGALGALYNSHATIEMNGQVIPGATAQARNNVTAIFDIGYDITKDFAVLMMSGIPPRTAVDGRGTVAPLGNLGAVRLGPVFLTGIYRGPEWGGFRPYVGAGFAHAFILKNYSGAVTDLNVHDNSGFALQAGVEYRLSGAFGLFVDYKRLWLTLNADGQLGSEPITARVTLDPNLVSAGVRFQF